MNSAEVSFLACPSCRAELGAGEGELRCAGCGSRFAVVEDIPLFCDDEIFWSEPGISEQVMTGILDRMKREDWHQVFTGHDVEAVRKHYFFINDLGRARWHDVLRLKPESTILDLGAGMGTVSQGFARHYRKIYAVDPVLVRCRFMKERFRQEGVTNVTVLRSDSRNLPFREGTFDHIIMNGVLEWVPYTYKSMNPRDSQVDVLRRLRGLLKKGGSISVGIENRHYYGYFLGAPDCHVGVKWVTVAPRALADYKCRKEIGDIYRPYLYSAGQLKGLLEEAGYADASVYCSLPSYNEPKYTININEKSARYPECIWPTNNRLSLAAKEVLQRCDLLKYLCYAFRGVAYQKQ